MCSISWRAHATNIGCINAFSEQEAQFHIKDQGEQIFSDVVKHTSSRLPNITETLNVGLIDTPSSFLALKRHICNCVSNPFFSKHIAILKVHDNPEF